MVSRLEGVDLDLVGVCVRTSSTGGGAVATFVLSGGERSTGTRNFPVEWM